MRYKEKIILIPLAIITFQFLLTGYILDSFDRSDLIIFLALNFLLLVSLLLLFLKATFLDPLKSISRLIREIQNEKEYSDEFSDDNEDLSKIQQLLELELSKIKTKSNETDNKIMEKTKEADLQRVKYQRQQKAVLNVLEDIAEEKKRVAEERDKINTVVKSVGDGLFVINKARKITIFNDVASEITGYADKEVLDKKYDDILKFKSSKKNVAYNDFIHKALDLGKSVEMPKDTVVVRKDGKLVPVGDSASPIKDKDGNITGCVVVFRDVTTEREIDRMKTEFVSLASHQLRTPLSALRWALSMLKAGDAGKLNSDQKVLLDRSYFSTTRMIDLVNSLLNISRIESGQLTVESKPTDVIELSKRVIQEYEPKLKKKNHKFTFITPEHKIDMLSTDPRLLAEVISNVLSNAIKYTPDKGDVAFKIFLDEKDIYFNIKDSGIGIPKLQQKKLFTKFFRADNAALVESEGTGLGLYFTKSVVELLDGRIDLKSEENKGTEVTICLPLIGTKAKKGTKTLS